MAEPSAFVSPKVDFAFRALMKNHRVRADFLTASLDIPPDAIQAVHERDIDTLHLREPYRQGILRYKLDLEDGRRMETLVALTHQPCWGPRSLSILSRLCIQQQDAAPNALDLMPIALIAILDDPDASQDLYTTYSMRAETTNAPYSPLFRIHQIDLSKARVRPWSDAPARRVETWARFLCAPDWMELHRCAHEDDILREAVAELEAIAADPESRCAYHTRHVSLEEYAEELYLSRQEGMRIGERSGFLRGETSGRQDGRREGRMQGYKEGVHEGRTQARMDIARAMLNAGADWQFIRSVTRLTHAQLDEVYSGIPKG